MINTSNGRVNISKKVTIICAIIIPGSGHVLLGKPLRGLLMVLWMFFFGYITFHLTRTNISIIGRFSGGIAIWLLSILEVSKLLSK
jgi:hypothetical protein